MTQRSHTPDSPRAIRAAERAEALRQLVEQGEPLKRAAWKVGVAERTARTYRQKWERG